MKVARTYVIEINDIERSILERALMMLRDEAEQRGPAAPLPTPADGEIAKRMIRAIRGEE